MAGIADVAKAAGVKEAEVKAVFEAIKNSADRVIIKGFGTFETKTRAARMGRNPQTGETISIQEKKVLAFKASK
ncbi:MAG: HU family DNA-binding protein [Desulfuromonadaceae bacterium]